MLIETATLDSLGEAVRIYTQPFNIATSEPLSPPVPMPGSRPLGSPVVSPSDPAIAVTTEERDPDGAAPPATFISLVDGETRQIAPSSWTISSAGWSHQAAALVPAESERSPLLVALATPQSPESVGPGRLEIHTLSRELPSAIIDKSATWLLPGKPAAALVLDGRDCVSVLCEAGAEGPVLHARDLGRGEVLQERLLVYDQPGLTPVGLAQPASGSILIAAATGPGSDKRSLHDATWIRTIDPKSWELLGASFELSGVLAPEKVPVQVSGDGTFWIATREPQSGFAYLTQLRANAAGIKKLAEYPFAGTDGPLLLAVARAGNDCAVAIGDRVEVWPGGNPGARPFFFDAPVNALAWTDDSLVVGEANRVHAIESVAGEMTPRLVAALQTGIVNAIVPLAGTPSRVPNADNRNAVLEAPLPHFVRLRGEAAGHELRAVQIIPETAGTPWRVEWDRRKIPWLSLYPQSGSGRGWFLMGVDSQLYERGSTVSGWIDVLTDPDAAAGGPQAYRIAVRVAPSRPPVRNVLWALGNSRKASLRDPDDPFGFSELADLLAAPPFHFSHRLASGPVTTPLTPYAIVVLDSKAIVAGMVTRQAVLDYVSRGGSLVYLTQSVEEPNRERVARWLAPAGLQLIHDLSAADRFVRVANTPLTRNVEDWRVSRAVALRTEPPWQVLMAAPDGRYAGFAVRRMGSGRIAALASPEFIQSENLDHVEVKQFASALFAWLGDAGMDVQDLDGDDLPDEREDRDQDGVVDPGETDRLNPDTDGDGVPDGVDVDPLNPDTDGDGTLDGADLTPNGPAGAAPGLLPLAE
ncbi:MAG: thrombospondin type 3 repeat-containing protein [Candidatus Hydrogenedentes bacterium]|nr:thrombospondin type 3 repeat-containing protein [Candidatus Hydrogenedentota bacterium]